MVVEDLFASSAGEGKWTKRCDAVQSLCWMGVKLGATHRQADHMVLSPCALLRQSAYCPLIDAELSGYRAAVKLLDMEFDFAVTSRRSYLRPDLCLNEDFD
ncbi:UNVERIFIED_CONTAM: hypothetical protein K2H54_057745 [Gekko kuhli]